MNLLRDAEDFGMKKLHDKIHREMAIKTNDTPVRLEPDTIPNDSDRRTKYLLVTNVSVPSFTSCLVENRAAQRGRWAAWNGETVRGTRISEATKEAIFLKLNNSDIVLVSTNVLVPQGYRVLAAWDKYPSSGDKDTKSFVLLEST